MLTEVGLIDPSFRLLQVARDYTTLLNYGNFRGNRVICDLHVKTSFKNLWRPLYHLLF